MLAMNRSTGIGVGLLLLAVALLWWWSGSAAPAPSPAASADAVADDAPALPPPAPPPPPPSTQPAALPAPPPPAPVAQAVEPEPPPAQPAAVPPAAPAQPTVPLRVPASAPNGPVGPVVLLKTAFENDPVDPQAESVEDDLNSRFAMSEVPKEMLHEVKCKQRSCRIGVTWLPDKPFGYMAVAMLLSLHLNSLMGVQPTGALNKDGTRELEILVARKGLTLQNFNGGAQ
jgi:hypothetical protein